MLLRLKLEKNVMSMLSVKGHGKTFHLQLYLVKKSQIRKLFLFGLLFFHGIVTFCNLCEFQAFEIFTD